MAYCAFPLVSPYFVIHLHHPLWSVGSQEDELPIDPVTVWGPTATGLFTAWPPTALSRLEERSSDAGDMPNVQGATVLDADAAGGVRAGVGGVGMVVAHRREKAKVCLGLSTRPKCFFHG